MQERVLALFAPVRHTRFRITATDGSCRALRVALKSTVTFLDSSLAMAIFLDALEVDTSICAFLLAFVSPPLVRLLGFPGIISVALVAIANHFVTAGGTAFLAVGGTRLIAPVAPSVGPALVQASAFWQKLT